MFGLKRIRKRSIPYDMFDSKAFGIEAKNARILERVYHKGNRLTWDGKEVLESLIKQYGKPKLPQDKMQALGNVFGMIMWGELAAWRISAELADEIEPLEAKMAATSQAFDEARHFYVMHDYLQAADAMPNTLDKGAQALLEAVMNADHLAKKLLGMQLMVEPIALALFHTIKKLELEPVLTHLLPYYERDEARHIALGTKYFPAMLTRMSVSERLSLFAFQMKLITYEVWSNYGLMRDMHTLGVDPKELLEVGKGKQTMALELVFEEIGQGWDLPSQVINRYADTLIELTMPDVENEMSLVERVRRSADVLFKGKEKVVMKIAPDLANSDTPLIHGLDQSSTLSKTRGGPLAH
jgi:hypothetical protein